MSGTSAGHSHHPGPVRDPRSAPRNLPPDVAFVGSETTGRPVGWYASCVDGGPIPFSRPARPVHSLGMRPSWPSRAVWPRGPWRTWPARLRRPKARSPGTSPGVQRLRRSTSDSHPPARTLWSGRPGRRDCWATTGSVPDTCFSACSWRARPQQYGGCRDSASTTTPPAPRSPGSVPTVWTNPDRAGTRASPAGSEPTGPLRSGRGPAATLRHVGTCRRVLWARPRATLPRPRAMLPRRRGMRTGGGPSAAHGSRTAAPPPRVPAMTGGRPLAQAVAGTSPMTRRMCTSPLAVRT
jgi:hypothetical protein